MVRTAGHEFPRALLNVLTLRCSELAFVRDLTAALLADDVDGGRLGRVRCAGWLR